MLKRHSRFTDNYSPAEFLVWMTFELLYFLWITLINEYFD